MSCGLYPLRFADDKFLILFWFIERNIESNYRNNHPEQNHFLLIIENINDLFLTNPFLYQMLLRFGFN